VFVELASSPRLLFNNTVTYTIYTGYNYSTTNTYSGSGLVRNLTSVELNNMSALVQQAYSNNGRFLFTAKNGLVVKWNLIANALDAELVIFTDGAYSFVKLTANPSKYPTFAQMGFSFPGVSQYLFNPISLVSNINKNYTFIYVLNGVIGNFMSYTFFFFFKLNFSDYIIYNLNVS
jgi:hypothetical protein